MKQFSPDVEQRLGFMHLHVADGTVFAGFQIAHDAHLADCKAQRQKKKEGNQRVICVTTPRFL